MVNVYEINTKGGERMKRVKQKRKRLSIDELVEDLKRVAGFLQKDSVSANQYRKYGMYGLTTYRRRFGTWANALRATGLEVPKQEYIKNFSRRHHAGISHSVILKIFKRDRHKCCLCGRIPSKRPFSELQIDHVFPVSKGGTNDISNLWTLCQKCNATKHDHVVPWIISKAETHIMWCNAREKTLKLFRQEAKS